MKNDMLKIIKDLTPLNRVFCSSDYDYAITYLKKQLTFNVVSFSKKDETNGWVIPPKWDVLEAKIIKDGKVIYDATKNPLSIIALSKSFKGVISLEELKKHLYFDRRSNDAIPYHFRQMYRSWDRDWGMCVTKKFYDNLTSGNYEVIIKTKEDKGRLKILEYVLYGRIPETFTFVAHLDHPGMSNDDLAGCAVGVELFKRLSKKPLKYTYSLVLLPEIIGSEFFLRKRLFKTKSKILESLFLEMLGTDTKIALQESMSANSNLERVVMAALDEIGIQYSKGPFKSIVGNDEIIWETYGIPMASISRYPYPEYHTNKDNISIISESTLEESVQVLFRAIEHLEETKLVFKRFQGSICLSNPKYDLYIDPGQPAFGKTSTDRIKGLRSLMDLIPTIQKPTSIAFLAKRVGLEENVVEEYLKKWEIKKLIELR